MDLVEATQQAVYEIVSCNIYNSENPPYLDFWAKWQGVVDNAYAVDDEEKQLWDLSDDDFYAILECWKELEALMVIHPPIYN